MKSKMDAVANASRPREGCEARRSGLRIIKHADQWGMCSGRLRIKVVMAYRRDSERVLLLIRHFLILHFTHAHNLRRGAEFLVVAEGLFHVHVEVLYQGQSYVNLRRQVER
jgi:hypothetical protein